jgi:hypothetical protein
VHPRHHASQTRGSPVAEVPLGGLPLRLAGATS